MNNQNDNSTKLCAFASALDSSYGEALQLKALRGRSNIIYVICGLLAGFYAGEQLFSVLGVAPC